LVFANEICYHGTTENSTAMDIEKWVTLNPASAEVDDKLEVAIEKMHELSIGAVLVMNKGKLAGIISESDLVRIYAESETHPKDEPIAKYMTTDPVIAQATDDYNSVYMMMRSNNIRHIPVLNGDELVGIVSVRDLIRFYQNQLETEYAEARERIEQMKRLVKLSAEEVLESLFSEINKYKELSLTDHLTGLYNKRYFLMRLQEEASRAIRYKEDLALIFCDIDHFKSINDTYGHHHGDMILREIGELLGGGMGDLKVVSRLRKSDIVARYGGEEFVIILPETPAERAAIAAEKMRATLEEYTFDIGSEKIKITMSFGVAGTDETTKDAEDLIQRADHAMYKAKESGRNRVEVY
jgi:diguanylate cyclase (GGDEF)-like protein